MSRGRFRPINSSRGDHCRITGPVGSRGPVVDVEIRLPLGELERSRLDGRIVPPPLRARAVIDTAAQRTCVLARTVSELLLDPVVRNSVSGTAGTVECPVYNLSLQFGFRLDRLPAPIEVFAPALQEILNAELLIGLDVLRHGRLTVYGPENRFELLLP